MKALIIDDEMDICYLLSGLLSKKNVQTHYANSLADAKRELQNDDPEIIFLDNHLPDGRGIDFIQHIKTTHPHSKLVMITAFDTAADKSAALSKGVDYFVPKPFSREKIYQALDHLQN